MSPPPTQKNGGNNTFLPLLPGVECWQVHKHSMGLREANKACELVNTEPGDCSQVVRMFKKVSEPWLHKRFFEHMNKL